MPEVQLRSLTLDEPNVARVRHLLTHPHIYDAFVSDSYRLSIFTRTFLASCEEVSPATRLNIPANSDLLTTFS
jgi:hypothetical protein